jgi:uncharacterized protein (DUF302 family)
MNPVLVYRIAKPFAEADPVIREALKAQGFGILTEVDVTKTLREKLGVESRPYRILGACNPKIAHTALSIEAEVGAFLPCGIAMYEGDNPGETVVAIQDPGIIGTAFTTEGLDAPAAEAREKLQAALAAVGTAV